MNHLFQMMTKMRSLLVVLLVLGASLVATASASAYLHLANAQNYAVGHVFSSFCNNSSYNCPGYPQPTAWYSRISDSYVRVEIYVNRTGSGQCYRVFAVRGSDAAPYITSDGSAPAYSCF